MLSRSFARHFVLIAAMMITAAAREGRAQTVAKKKGSGSRTPLADSVTRLNGLRKWEEAAALARASLNGKPSLNEQCGLLLGLAFSEVHIGQLDDAKPVLDSFLGHCRRVATAKRSIPTADSLRRQVALPPLPRTGVDFSSVDAFWHLADVLAADKEPSQTEWTALFATTGYRLAIRFAPSLRNNLEIALRPSRRHAFDSLAAITTNPLANRPLHLAHAYADRAALVAYRDSVARNLPVQRATALAGRFLPPHTTEGRAPPLVAFLFFADDAFSIGPEAVIVDLEHVRLSGDLTMTLAHEFHHSYLFALSAITYPAGADASATLLRALSSARNEGIADLIDKPYPLTRPGRTGELYARIYNGGYARTPAVIHSIDSALVVAADDSTKLPEVGARVTQLLPGSGHYNGAYVAREIYDAFGVDSLFPGVSNVFAFWRAYAESELKRGNPPPFSARAVTLLNALEKKYVVPPTPRAQPFEF